MGRSAGQLDRAALSAKLDSWAGEFADCMPSNERVQQLIFEEKVLDLADFMAVYEAPVDTQMKSATVWPPDRHLLY